MRLTSNAGHSAGSPGASGNGYKEHEVARRLNAAFIAITDAIDSTSDAGTQNAVLAGQASTANASGADLAVSWHLNASTPAASGVEVLYYAGSADGKAFAERVSAAISNLLGIPNRGAKARSDLYWLNQTRMTAILIEVGFISNANDIRLVIAHIDDIARVTATALGAVRAPVPSVSPAPYHRLLLAHISSQAALQEVVGLCATSHMAVAVSNVGRMYDGAISHTDALRYIGEHGRAAAEMFPGIGRQSYSVIAIHAPLAWLEKAIVPFLQQTNVAHVLYEVGDKPRGYDNMTDALVQMLEVGVDRQEVFGT